MLERRSRLERSADVLRAIRDAPQNKSVVTHVMYRAALSWRDCMKLIEDLLRREMLVEEQNGGSWKRTFVLTQNGRIWLQNFDAVYGQLHDLSIQLQQQQATNSS